MNNALPELASVDAFAEYLVDDDRTEFTAEDLLALNAALQVPVRVIRAGLEAYGLRLAARAPEAHVRGFTTSSHDRWFGPGSCPTHGGAAYGQMMVQKYGSKDSIFG